MSPPVETSNPHDRVYRECARRFDGLADGQEEIKKLLRGDGVDPGLLTVVDRLSQNGRSRKSAERENRTLFWAAMSKLATAAIIALAAWLLSFYRWGGPMVPRPETAQPAAAEATDDTHAQPARPAD